MKHSPRRVRTNSNPDQRFARCISPRIYVPASFIYKKRIIWADAICSRQQDIKFQSWETYTSQRCGLWCGLVQQPKNTFSIRSRLAAIVMDGQRSSKQKGTATGKTSKVESAKESDEDELDCNDTLVENLVQLPWWSRI